jgi:proton-translocating NADH-quinone oxidoreductase chain M
MSAALEALWSAATAAQQAPRLAAAFQPLLAAVTPAVATPAPTVPGVPPATLATPTATPTPAATPATSSGLDLPSVLLSTVVFATTVAALVIVFLPERTAEQRSRIRSIALLGAVASLLLTLLTLASAISLGVAATPGQLHEENASWITQFSFVIHYHLSADGITLSLLVLSTLVFTSVFLAAWKRQQRLRFYCGLLLLLETAVNGALCATDLVLFAMFFAMQVVPLYLLIRCFGGSGREQAARRTGVAMLVSSALLITGFLLVITHSGAHSSDLGDLLAAKPLPGAVATAGFWLVFTAFALGFVIVPTHTWIVSATATASSGVAAVIAGVLVRLSGYGMIRFAIGLFPAQAQRAGSALMVLAVLSAVWGVILTIGQRTLRRMVAAVSIGQMSLVLLAVAAPNTISLAGAVLQLVAGGLSSALLLLLCGAIEGRTRSAPLDRMGGLATQAPRLGGFWIFACLAALGAPLLAGFSAELMLFTGTFAVHPYATAVVMASTAVSTAALLWSAQRIFLGPVREEFSRVRDTSTLELSYLWPLVVFLIGFGLLAGRVVPVIGTGLTRIAASLGGAQ